MVSSLIYREMVMVRVVVFVLGLMFANVLFADCQSGGKTYPEGKRVGPYVCESGKWVRK
jgi:hypothetical protein